MDTRHTNLKSQKETREHNLKAVLKGPASPKTKT